MAVSSDSNMSAMYDIVLNSSRLIEQAEVEGEIGRRTWDKILDNIERITIYCEKNNVNSPCVDVVHKILTKIESLLNRGLFTGSQDKVFSLIERCSYNRPESSVFFLMDHLFTSIQLGSEWIEQLNLLLTKFYVNDVRCNVRIKALQSFRHLFNCHQRSYEKELIDGTVTKFLANISLEQDNAVQNFAVQMLIDMALQSHANNITIILDILEMVLDKPFELSDVKVSENQYIVSKMVVEGLINIFANTLCKTSSNNPIKILNVLVTHLDKHYSSPDLFVSMIELRSMILKFLLDLQIDSLYHLGYSKHPKLGLIYSPYILVESELQQKSQSAAPPLSPLHKSVSIIDDKYHPLNLTYISAQKACKMIKIALSNEQDWRVLFVLLQKIQSVVKNKILIYLDIEPIVIILCNMVSERSLNLPDNLTNTPIKFTSSDFLEHVFPILSMLVSHTSHLEPNLQLRLIKCLELGLVSRNASKCVNALTISILEMPDTMVKLLPEVLLNLSKISATVHIAIPVLEFLSMLTNFPHVFINFVPDQYMSVFAISLPYTNPLKYNHYVVSLAHHVISVWFLKCKLTLRKDFVKYIITGLKSNALFQRTSIDLQQQQQQQSNNKSSADCSNEDSSNRKRCSSFIEQGTKQKDAATTTTSSKDQKRLTIFGGSSTIDKPSSIQDLVMVFHRELTETCIDLMSRYTFSGCEALPTKHNSSEFIFKNGNSMTWLLGSKLITITTSGCTQKPIRGDLCDRCYKCCVLDVDGILEIGNDLNQKTGAAPEEMMRRSYTLDSSIDDVKRRPLPFFKNFQTQNQTSQSELFQDQICSCWCQRWAKIKIRRPTGDTSWIMRLENEPTNANSNNSLDYLLSDVSTLNLASVMNKGLESRSSFSSEVDVSGKELLLESNPNEQEIENVFTDCADSNFHQTVGNLVTASQLCSSAGENLSKISEAKDNFDDQYSRNPVCRSNSSPEMNSNLKIPFLNRSVMQDNVLDSLNKDTEEKKSMKNFSSRGNCEAIPEECIQGHQNERPNLEIKVPSDSPDHYMMEHKSLPTSPTKNMEYFSGSKYDRNFYSQMKSVKKSVALTSSKPPLSFLGKTTPSASSCVRQIGKDPQELSQIDYSNLDFKRHRHHTVSVMSSVKRTSINSDYLKSNTRNKEPVKSGVNPSFIFLQLYHSAQFGVSYEKPLLLPSTQAIQRCVTNFDWIPPYETHKVGVIYVGPGQANDESKILRNYIGSARYICFLQKLGILLKLSQVDPQNLFLGGLDTNGTDGEFAYMWKDDVMQVIFHVATLMSNNDDDPNCCNKKKLHIGNDYVVIVYNESGEDYQPCTIKSQVNFASIIIEPLDNNSNQVTVKVRKDLNELVGQIDPKIVSDDNVSLLARQLALHLNLSSKVSYSLSNSKCGEIYASNWLERFRKIKQIRQKILEELNQNCGGGGGLNNSNASSGNVSAVGSKNCDSSSSSNKHNIYRKMQVCDFTEYT